MRLRKHSDYQRVYRESRKQFSPLMSYFYTDRSDISVTGPRVGLTAGKVLGTAVERNRIKRRMREAVRRNLALLDRNVDVVLHPRRTVLEVEWPVLEKEVASVFRKISRPVHRPGKRSAEEEKLV